MFTSWVLHQTWITWSKYSKHFLEFVFMKKNIPLNSSSVCIVKHYSDSFSKNPFTKSLYRFKQKFLIITFYNVKLRFVISQLTTHFIYPCFIFIRKIWPNIFLAITFWGLFIWCLEWKLIKKILLIQKLGYSNKFIYKVICYYYLLQYVNLFSKKKLKNIKKVKLGQ